MFIGDVQARQCIMIINGPPAEAGGIQKGEGLLFLSLPLLTLVSSIPILFFR